MKQKYFMLTCGFNYYLWAFIFLAIIFVPLSYGKPIFTDDFGSGNLDNWVIGGRQLGSNTANVVSFEGSLSGHLQHSSFTEITMYRDFQFDQFDTNDSFYFDLAVDVSSSSPHASNYYGWAGLEFRFLDANSDSLGSVLYGAATTDYPFDVWSNSDNISVNQIPEGGMRHYEITITDMLSQIILDQTQIKAIRMEGKTYSSTYPLPSVSAELWIDNVSTVGSQTSLIDSVPDSPNFLTQTQVSQLYVSIFGRASEGQGNAYWCANQNDMTNAANTMLDTDPAKVYFGTTLNDNQAFIEFIYENTLGKTYAEDPDGIDYWVDELASGKSKGQVIAALINAAMEPQYTGSAAQNQFINKVTVSNYTADHIITCPNVNDLSAFVNFISGVTDDSATVTAMMTFINSYIPPILNTYYYDYDSDGWGDPNNSAEFTSQPSGYTANNTDCDDYNSSIHPEAKEICGDGIDQNCDGVDPVCPQAWIVGSWIPTHLEGVPAGVTYTGSLEFKSNNTYTFYFYSKGYYDLQGTGNYTLNNSTLSVDGPISYYIGSSVNLTSNSDNSMFQYVDLDGDRHTWSKGM